MVSSRIDRLGEVHTTSHVHTHKSVAARASYTHLLCHGDVEHQVDILSLLVISCTGGDSEPEGVATLVT